MMHVLATTFCLLLSVPAVVFAADPSFSFSIDSVIKPKSIEELVLAVLNILIVIATPIIVLFIIYAGFLYVTAQGNAEQTKQATRALTYAIIGGVLILGAVALAEVLKNIVAAFS